MQSHHTRAGRWPLALTLALVAACADQPATTAPTLQPNATLGVGTVFTVTSTGEGTDVGTLRWAMVNARSGDAIRFDPRLAGDTIAIDAPLETSYYVTIEGPPTRGITVSGRDAGNVLRFYAGGTVRNITVTGGFGTSGNAIYAIGQAPSVGTGAVYDPDAVIVLHNSIIANNGSPLRNCVNTIVFRYEGMNIANDASCGNTAGIVVTDPRLLGLADNGGPSMTEAFDYQSPALNAGSGCQVAVDQRYVPRDADCDVGAVEFTDFTRVSITLDPNASVDRVTGSAVVSGTVKCSRVEPLGLLVKLELTNGYLFAFPVALIRALDRATPAQLAAVEIDPSGGALRWDGLDVDVSVPGVLLSAVGLKERLRHLASLAGRVSTDAKARAARANGLKGGRPTKRAGKPKAGRR